MTFKQGPDCAFLLASKTRDSLSTHPTPAPPLFGEAYHVTRCHCDYLPTSLASLQPDWCDNDRREQTDCYVHSGPLPAPLTFLVCDRSVSSELEVYEAQNPGIT